MARFSSLRWLLLAAPLLTGCGMCQNCLDITGPVQQAPNQPDYYNSPRVNSAVGGAPVTEGQMMPAQPPAQLNP